MRTAATVKLTWPLHCRCHNLRLLTISLYEQERSLREHDARDTGTAHTREIAKLQAELKKTEDCLGRRWEHAALLLSVTMIVSSAVVSYCSDCWMTLCCACQQHVLYSCSNNTYHTIARLWLYSSNVWTSAVKQSCQPLHCVNKPVMASVRWCILPCMLTMYCIVLLNYHNAY
jgi:hypothetical protein